MRIDEQFPLDDGLIYLNHAAISPWPRVTSEAVSRFARENMHEGSMQYPRWLETEQSLRLLLQALINAQSSDEIAFVKNTSEALSIVAYGLDWRDGDNIVIPAGEFPSNRMVWESLAGLGVSVRTVNLDGPITPEKALIEAIDSNTRLVSVSSVQYHNGLRLNLEQLGEACRHRDVYFCVDAIQSLGALPFDVQACQADFVAADGHKWMMGPEGLALFYCREALLPRLKLHQFGWHMAESIGDFERSDWSAALTARRFECGSPNMLAIHALHASLALLLSQGIDAVERQILERSGHIQAFLQRHAKQFTSLSSAEPTRQSGIVSFRPRHVEIKGLFQQLSAQQVFCAIRAGGIRFSPHFYTPMEKLEQAFDLLLSLAKV